jgi:hypothetical protein
MGATHYLLVTVSGHLLVRANGRIFRQKKSHGLKLKGLEQGAVTPLVHFFIYDPENQSRYAEIGCKGHMPDLKEFLSRAYNPVVSALKLTEQQSLVVPQSVVDAFPGVVSDLEQMGISAFKPISGFKSGIAYLRSWESQISYDIMHHSESRFEAIAPLIPKIAFQASRLILESPYDDDSDLCVQRAMREQMTNALGPCANERTFREFYARKVALSDCDICPGEAPNYHFPDRTGWGDDYVYSGYDWTFKANDKRHVVPLMTRGGKLSERIFVAAEALPEEFRYQQDDKLVGMPLYEAISRAIDRSPTVIPGLLVTLAKFFSLLPPGAERLANSTNSWRYGPNPVSYLSAEGEKLGFELRHADWTQKDIWRSFLWWKPGDKFCGEFQISWNTDGPDKISLFDPSPRHTPAVYSKLALRSITDAPRSLFSDVAINELLTEWKRRQARRIAWRAKRSTDNK